MVFPIISQSYVEEFALFTTASSLMTPKFGVISRLPVLSKSTVRLLLPLQSSIWKRLRIGLMGWLRRLWSCAWVLSHAPSLYLVWARRFYFQIMAACTLVPLRKVLAFLQKCFHSVRLDAQVSGKIGRAHV